MFVQCAFSTHVRQSVTSLDTEDIGSNLKFRTKILFKKLNKWLFQQNFSLFSNYTFHQYPYVCTFLFR